MFKLYVCGFRCVKKCRMIGEIGLKQFEFLHSAESLTITITPIRWSVISNNRKTLWRPTFKDRGQETMIEQRVV